MNLVIVSDIILDPPSEALFVRYLTMKSNQELGMCNLIESKKGDWDKIYKILKNKYYWDFFYDFVEPEYRVEGIRIDTELNYSKTIKVNKISCENAVSILGQIQFIRQL